MADNKLPLEVEGKAVRERLVKALRIELLGPEAPDEVLNQSPNTRYLVGMLAPSGTPLDPVEDEGFEGEEADEQNEGHAPTAASLDPSSIGISFAVEVAADPVPVTFRWGEYAKSEKAAAAEDEEAPVERDDDPGETAERKRRKHFEWPRTQHEMSKTLPVEATGGLEKEELAPGVEMQWLGRALHGFIVFSVFLVNVREAPADVRPEDTAWIYQPEIVVAPETPVIVARDLALNTIDPDPDIASSDLTYRKKRELATGHGVSADWDLAEGEVDRASRVWTTVIPERDVPIVSPAGAGVPPLEMDALADAEGEALAAILEPLAKAYEGWIGEREAELETIPEPLRQVGVDHLALARKALTRMREGIEVIRDDERAGTAFRFANRAMALQMRQSMIVRRKRRGEEPRDDAPTWRPFQMGFILTCMASIADPTHEDRDLADLLWFPTGGGKTEAYLGLTAFTLSLRRLRKDPQELNRNAGVAVLMRYTLRLLTIQQFQRALTLVCACEQVRLQDMQTFGPHRFTIGLWVGEKATPNNYKDSADAIARLRDGEKVFRSSPYQVLYCPWCGEDLTPWQYTCDDDLQRTLVHCSSQDCDFSGSNSKYGLPVLLVDQEIYRNPPSVLLATVDKFAQMPLNGRIQALFGRVERHCPRHGYLTAAEGSHPQRHLETKANKAAAVAPAKRLAPPDLIIQDELHLISGPLGTLVGLYEVAVQALCTREHGGNVLRPKVISSTATIRRAQSQVEGLFGLDVAVFPPLGLEADKSFFAQPADPDEWPGRKYIGVYAPGKSLKTALVRVYGALLSRALHEFDQDPNPTSDAYMTLVGYFNSLRELGGAVRLVEDDVPARLRVLQRRGFGPRRTIYEKQELTSRISSSEIPKRLQELERTFMDKKQGAYPTDVLMASNMLSVGVDIDRLGLMVVSGQPKTSAEYIQATSRVGRKHPGLIVDVFNWIRPRDTSHYERFRHYHDTFYRHVEATSVTPFSARARDRAFPALLAGYVRLADEGSSPEAAARNFRQDNETVIQIVEFLTRRAYEATGRDDVRVETELQLKNLIDEWEDRAKDDEPKLVYTRSGLGSGQKAEGKLNLLRPMEQRGGKGCWAVAGSLREVEPEVDVVLRDGGM